MHHTSEVVKCDVLMSELGTQVKQSYSGTQVTTENDLIHLHEYDHVCDQCLFYPFTDGNISYFKNKCATLSI